MVCDVLGQEERAGQIGVHHFVVALLRGSKDVFSSSWSDTGIINQQVYAGKMMEYLLNNCSNIRSRSYITPAINYVAACLSQNFKTIHISFISFADYSQIVSFFGKPFGYTKADPSRTTANNGNSGYMVLF